METSITAILGLVFVGAFAGFFYWTALVVFMFLLYMQYTKAKGINKLFVLLGHAIFTPTLALSLLGIYGLYSLFKGDMPISFFIGSLWPLAILLHETLTKDNE